MKILHIMRGLPGSGKSTTARNLNLSIHAKGMNNDPIMSAIYATDDFWVRPNGTYDFNYDLVGAAHKWNQNRVEFAMRAKFQDIIVDNVNSTWKEIQPYVRLAYLYGYMIQLHESDAPWAMNVEECYERTLHGVPYATILRMYHEWEDTNDIRRNIEQYEVEQ